MRAAELSRRSAAIKRALGAGGYPEGMNYKTWLLMTAALAAGGPAAANGFRSLAKDLSTAARGGGIARVAVMPFVSADGSPSKEGWNISERLVTQLAQTGRVQAVERSMLQKLLEEHHLGEAGVLDQATLKGLGKMASADAIVTGSFFTSGARVVIDARLVNVETGLIVGACEREVDRDGLDPAASDLFGPAAGQTLYVPPPEFIADVPRIEPDEAAGLKDAVAADPCAGAEDRADALEEQVLDLKARYWALQLRQGVDASRLKSNPGSTISDPRLRRRFYERLKDWHEQPVIPGLTEEETRRFVAADGKAYALHERCGI